MKILSIDRILNLVVVLLFSVACSDSSEKDTLSPENTDSCLAEFALEPCSLLDEAWLVQNAAADEQSIEVEPPDIEPGEEVTAFTQVHCMYTWPSERVSVMTVKLGDTEVETDMTLKNNVLVGNLKVITEEDLLDFNDENYVDYYNRNYAINNEDTQQDISGFGVRAVASVISQAGHSNWRKTSLSVLHENVVFTVEADVSDNDQEDLEMVKKVAEEILAQCN